MGINEKKWNYIGAPRIKKGKGRADVFWRTNHWETIKWRMRTWGIHEGGVIKVDGPMLKGVFWLHACRFHQLCERLNWDGFCLPCMIFFQMKASLLLYSKITSHQAVISIMYTTYLHISRRIDTSSISSKSDFIRIPIICSSK